MQLVRRIYKVNIHTHLTNAKWVEKVTPEGRNTTSQLPSSFECLYKLPLVTLRVGGKLAKWKALEL